MAGGFINKNTVNGRTHTHTLTHSYECAHTHTHLCTDALARIYFELINSLTWHKHCEQSEYNQVVSPFSNTNCQKISIKQERISHVAAPEQKLHVEGASKIKEVENHRKQVSALIPRLLNQSNMTLQLHLKTLQVSCHFPVLTNETWLTSIVLYSADRSPRQISENLVK